MSKGQLSSIPSVEGIADITDVIRPTSTARAARVALVTSRTNVSDRLACFVDCGSPRPRLDRLVIDHRARDPDHEVVWDHAGKVFNNLGLASRQPMADVRRGTGDRTNRV